VRHSVRRLEDVKSGTPHLVREPASSFFITSSTLKLDGYCRGGNSLKLEIHFATKACAGPSTNMR
jgi:hypothetical protein